MCVFVCVLVHSDPLTRLVVCVLLFVRHDEPLSSNGNRICLDTDSVFCSKHFDPKCCNEWHSFHARVGRFSPFLYLRSVAIAVILFWLQLVVLVSPCFLGPRIPRDYRFPPAPLFLCSERKPSSLTTGSSKL